MQPSFTRLFGVRHVRTRLTLWHVFVLVSVLLLSWGLTASFLFLQLRSQLDHYAIQDIETVEGLLYFHNGTLSMHEEYHNHPASKQVLERFLEVLSPEGAVLYRNERLDGQALGSGPIKAEGEGGYSERSARLADGTPVRLVSRRHTLEGCRGQSPVNALAGSGLAYGSEILVHHRWGKGAASRHRGSIRRRPAGAAVSQPQVRERHAGIA